MVSSRRIVSLISFLWAMASGLVAAPAHAQSMSRLSLEDLTKSSDLIIHGVVNSSTADWDREHARIYTTTSIRVIEAIKGSAPAGSVSLSQLGGTVGETNLSVLPELPTYVKDEEVLVFLHRVQGDRLIHTGMLQGKFTVITDAVTGAKSLLRDLDSAEVADAVSAGTDPAGISKLDDMIAAIRRIPQR